MSRMKFKEKRNIDFFFLLNLGGNDDNDGIVSWVAYKGIYIYIVPTK